jgi:hypothetical protein
MAYKQFKKSLKIPKGQSESVYRRTDLPKEKVQKDKQGSTKFAIGQASGKVNGIWSDMVTEKKHY